VALDEVLQIEDVVFPLPVENGLRWAVLFLYLLLLGCCLDRKVGSFSLLVKMTEQSLKKAQTSKPVARAVSLGPYKTSEISNRLAGLRANEQYHQMY
jgi:hypothetical protein